MNNIIVWVGKEGRSYSVVFICNDAWPNVYRRNLTQLQAYRLALELANNPEKVKIEAMSMNWNPIITKTGDDEI